VFDYFRLYVNGWGESPNRKNLDRVGASAPARFFSASRSDAATDQGNNSGFYCGIAQNKAGKIGAKVERLHLILRYVSCKIKLYDYT
jgi:hypothetical protein